ncbi:proton-coupled amino acid transporter-like protein pathetic [Ceratina calcarata]|uniref:Proton-coupled amino acid transporter-like protein pathetic n=1 Tax=Ceratina calcarata TaxID=156304 RepID=A0AAJ7IZW7_9HYME|nr:proton-coupled amino acid transporter-like protein pathetic [Ceratina calcarata]XP_017881280.1 proton-coupled amino acid transporter-like protein pathetic [Ceratina calcarata]XP_017881281.1 proton-coupled amino acid transporter-like protein pathetic [Ceratina calcarata]
MEKKPKQEEAMGNPMQEFNSSTKIAMGEYNEKDELYNPFEQREKKNTNSDLGSLAHLLKSSLGTGILAMPNAIKNGGVLFGGVGTIIIGMICAHCVHILVRSSHVLCKKTKTPKMTYAETAEAAFLSGPKWLRPFANASRIFVNAALCATYVGGACVYVVFVSTSIKQVVDYHTGTDISTRMYILTLIPALLLLGQVRNLKFMVPFSMMANVSMMVGFAITLYYIFNGIEIPSDTKLIASAGQLPTFFATVLFAIEGIGVVMPVENNMQNPQHFLGCPGVLNITMSIVVSLYALLGVFGYLKYGEAVMGSITLNIPTSDVLGQVVKMLIALAVLFTYGLQYYVPLEIMWKSLKEKCSHKYQGVCHTMMRVVMVLFTVFVALLVPDLEPFISLVGSVFFSILGVTIPAVVETISCWDGHLGTHYWRLWKNGTLVIFSFLALIFGAWISIVDIINMYQ